MAKGKFFRKKDGYGRLKRKIFWQMIALISLSFFIIWFLYIYVFFGHIANFVVDVLGWFGMSYEQALDYYTDVFRRNFEFFILIAALGCFFLLLRFFLNWFMKYFREIDAGMDALMDRKTEQIRLSEEIKPMEQKLTLVKETLAQQFADIETAEQKKDEMVMYLAHDIRTPLTSVIGYLKLMQEMPDLTEEQREKFLGIIMEKALRLEVLVNEFFDIARYSRQDISAEEEEIDLCYMVSQMAEEVYPSLQEAKKTVEISVPEECTVYGSPEKLARVFLNLLRNAIHYSLPDSTIRIQAKEREQETEISFSNPAEPMTPEQLAHIFEKFYRMDEARQTNKGGAGLGLAIAKELVELHGGTIVADYADGRMEFRVTLPQKVLRKPS